MFFCQSVCLELIVIVNPTRGRAFIYMSAIDGENGWTKWAAIFLRNPWVSWG